ncbi:MAG: NUDIX domain-containing protein [Candidatus Paceibacterota bacterium]|jgi:8-oxo-dGTP pyrophosphatase MutT (NUDIX family)
MKIIKEIREKDVGLNEEERFDKPYLLRKASRAVVFNDNNEIAFQFASKHKYYKLPGGGVEKGETIKEALKREVLEESGCEIDITDEVGIIIEYRNKFDTLQISYCFLAKVIGGVGSPEYEEAEIDEGLTPMWVPIEKAIKLIEETDTDNYQGKLIRVRDLLFLKEAFRLINKREHN